VKNYLEKFSLATENPNSRAYNTRNRIVHDCDLFVKKIYSSNDCSRPQCYDSKSFNHLPLALKMNVTEKSFVTNVKKLVQEFLFYDKSEYFGHKSE
jgi:hypothetical protein